MSMSDPIADMLTRIRNGLRAHKVSVSMPASKVKQAIVSVMKDEGYITDFEVTGEGAEATLTVELKYFEGAPVIEKVERVRTRDPVLRHRRDIEYTRRVPRREILEDGVVKTISARIALPLVVAIQPVDFIHSRLKRRTVTAQFYSGSAHDDFSCFKISLAALRPGAPLMPPPGWVPAPHNHSPSMGVRYC